MAYGCALMKKLLWGGLLLLINGQIMAKECVVLLHGLGRTSYSMYHIEKAFKQQGFVVVNQGYPSRKDSIANLVHVVGDAVQQCQQQEAQKIHFVTHSMGGILVRQYFQQHQVPQASRLVMLGPANHGSEISSRYKNAWWYQITTGKAGQELGIEQDSVPNQLKAISLEIGIIAGNKSIYPWFGSAVPKPHDGKVSVASAKLTEMADFIEVPYSHTFMMNAAPVIAQIQHFLLWGKFQR
jgi:triacylglycerol lipase